MNSNKRKKRLQYLAARDGIINMILDRDMRVGELLPTLDSLSGQLGIGRISVQRAVKMLAEEGVVEGVRGSGCYLRRLPNAADGAKDDGRKIIIDEFLGGGYRAKLIKTLKFGVSQPELEMFPSLWSRIILGFQKRHPSVKIEIKPITGFDHLDEELAAGALDIIQVPCEMLSVCVDGGHILSPENFGDFEISRKEFYPAFVEAVTLDGVPWGTPMITSVLAMYSRSDFNDIRTRFEGAEGFWGFLGQARDLATERSGGEGFITNDLSLPELFFLSNACRPIDEKTLFLSDEFQKFLIRLEDYYKASGLFHQTAHLDSLDAPVRLFDGRSPIVLGNSCWIPSLLKGNCEFGVSRLPLEPAGSLKANALINVASSNTLHPFECVDFLRFLAEFETQKTAASAGRCVARRVANEYLSVKNFDSGSKQALLDSFERCVVPPESRNDADHLIRQVIKEESAKWSTGNLSIEELKHRVLLKIEFIERGFKIKKANENNINAGRRLCEVS